MSELDRVSYAFGCKLNMGNFESATIQISMSSDLRNDETKEDALKRVSSFVDTEVDKRRELLKGKTHGTDISEFGIDNEWIGG